MGSIQKSKTVTSRSTYRRLARRLQRDGEYLRTSRDGDVYTLDDSGRVVWTFINVVKVAREMGVLKPFECVVYP
jgi:hypothetical protein